MKMQEFEKAEQQYMIKKENRLTCQESNTVTFLCASPSCTHSSFVCSSETCKCKTMHQTCLLVEPHRLTKIIQKKLIDSKGIFDEVERIVNQCIDWISDWRDNMQNQLKYYGLTQLQKKYILAIHNNSSQNINGGIMFDVVQSANLQNNVAQVQKAIKSIQQFWNGEKKVFQGIFNEIQSMVCKTQTGMFYVESLSSKIVKKRQDLKVLISLFDKRIKSFKLLYRASENDFSVAAFYNQCSNIPNTVILIRTQFDKIIGGFTPLCWKIGKKEQNFGDSSKQSFIFSLTHKDKFRLITPQKAIQYYGDTCGPRFGGEQGASDLTIKDRANLANESYALFNNCYYNQNYKKSDTDSYIRFNGGESNFFKIIQWQVFEVEFK